MGVSLCPLEHALGHPGEEVVLVRVDVRAVGSYKGRVKCKRFKIVRFVRAFCSLLVVARM